MNVRFLRRAIVIALAAALFAAPRFAARAESAEAWPVASALAPGALAQVDLDGGAAVYTFAVPANSAYDICLFPAEAGALSVRAELWQGAALLAEGEGSLAVISERLTAGEAYTLRITGAGRARLEVARHALSRCFGMPMALDADGGAYAKAFARRGDAHWYALAPGDGRPVMLSGVPAEDGLRLQAQLFDEAGQLLAEADRTVGGAFLMDFRPEAGRTYRVRVTATNGATGLYDLRAARSAGDALPDRVALSCDAMTLMGREAQRLFARVSPAEAEGLIYWESSDPSVASVDAQGEVSGLRPGTAVVTAYAAGGAYARCRVEVARVRAAGVRLLARTVEMNDGDDAAIEYRVLPSNASDPRVAFEVAPEGVVEIGAGGVLRAVGEGEAVVVARTLDGGWEDAMTVRVSPAPKRWRALLVGEQNYAATAAAVRPGSANSVAGLRGMLGQLSMDGAKYQVTTLLDASRDAALAAVRDAFADAAEGDLSLFYITCHGYYADGMTCFRMYDGSVLTAAELAQALRRVPGTVFAIIDCCGSGGVIGRASGTGDILRGIDAVFGGQAGAAAMDDSRFMVLASAALEQDSYRISFDDGAAESGMATVFARALCDAGGWSIGAASRGAMRADADFDGAVTLNELYVYAARRVMWYLEAAGRLSGGAHYVQSVQVWPEGCAGIVFARD